jgi:hypothetical protein
MRGLETYTGTKRTIVGIDWLSAASGALKTAGGAFGGGGFGGSGGGDAAAKEAQLQAARAQAAAAQQSASNWKWIGIGAVVVVLGGVLLLRKK